jgi:hypothetical protein
MAAILLLLVGAGGLMAGLIAIRDDLHCAVSFESVHPPRRGHIDVQGPRRLRVKLDALSPWPRSPDWTNEGHRTAQLLQELTAFIAQ